MGNFEDLDFLDKLAVTIREVNKKNGWDITMPDDWGNDPNKLAAKLALVHSEISEALEAIRKSDLENFLEELIDGMIRILDIAGAFSDDLTGIMYDKIAVNANRGYKHGGKKL